MWWIRRAQEEGLPEREANTGKAREQGREIERKMGKNNLYICIQVYFCTFTSRESMKPLLLKSIIVGFEESEK